MLRTPAWGSSVNDSDDNQVCCCTTLLDTRCCHPLHTVGWKNRQAVTMSEPRVVKVVDSPVHFYTA